MDARVAVVTGAASGIGRAEAVALGAAGADVVIVGHANLAGAEETRRLCEARGRRAIVVRADVLRGEEVRHAVEAVINAFGRIDILVNNAGALPSGATVPLTELSEESWHLTLDAHLTGTFLWIKHAAPSMVARGWGRIINTASVHGRVGGRATLGAYGAAKAGIIALTRTAARELGPHGVTCNVVSPGYIRTQNLESLLPPARLAALAAQAPVERLGSVEEVAAAVVFLASDAASYVNGAILDVHGGRTEYL